MRKLLALALVSLALAALVPFLPKTWAVITRFVEPSGGDAAQYTISTTETQALVNCWIADPPNTPTVRRNRANTSGRIFRCINNFNSSVTLYWSIYDDGGMGLQLAPGASTSLPAGATSCVTVPFVNTPNWNGTYTVTFRGTTASSANFYVDIFFTGQVAYSNATGGCI